MRDTAIAVAVAVLLALAGCSGDIGSAPVTGTHSPAATDESTTATSGERATDSRDTRNVSTAKLERVALRLATTSMGQPTVTVRATVSAGERRVTVRRDDATNVTTHEVALPANWSRRLVRNLDDEQSPEPETVSVVSDYEETFVLTLQFENTTVVVRANRIGGPASPSVKVGDKPVYYSDDPELRAVLGEMYFRLSQPEESSSGPPTGHEQQSVCTSSYRP